MLVLALPRVLVYVADVRADELHPDSNISFGLPSLRVGCCELLATVA
jgi:hypothetical protein